MRIKRTFILIFTIVFSIIFIGFVCIFAPYILTSKSKLYEQGLVEKRKGFNRDVINSEHLFKALINFRIAMIKGYKGREIFINTYWCYHEIDFGHPCYRSIETVLTKGLKYYPHDIEFYYRRANARLGLRKFKDALSDYDNAILYDKTRKYEYINDAFYNRGAIKYMLGNSTGAKYDFVNAQKITTYELRVYQDYCKQWK
jgi:tetratricopeptide (TPR) repeat protein